MTQLIDSPRLVALKERHGQSEQVVVDVSERIWALFGTAVHKLIEDGLPHSNWHMAEERVFTTLNGWAISGAVDLQLLGEKEAGLIDWKVCSIWAVLKGKPEWERQLNTLAFLIEKEKGLKITSLQIGALIRDWSRADASRDPTYPPTPFHMVDIPLWSFADREAYVRDRVRLHQEAEMAMDLGDEPEPCTNDEMWVRDETWAVWKPGNKRATKVCDTKAQAEQIAATIPQGYVQHRPGARTRCASYCEAAKFCVHASEGTGF